MPPTALPDLRRQQGDFVRRVGGGGWREEARGKNLDGGESIGSRGAQTTNRNDTIKKSGLPWGSKPLFRTMLRGLKTLTPRGSKRAPKKPQTHRRRGSKTALEAPTGGLKTPFQNFHFLGDVCGETFFFGARDWRTFGGSSGARLAKYGYMTGVRWADFWRQFGRMIGTSRLQDGRQMGTGWA